MMPTVNINGGSDVFIASDLFQEFPVNGQPARKPRDELVGGAGDGIECGSQMISDGSPANHYKNFR